MTRQITPKQQTYDLVLVDKTPIDRNPAAVYLACLSKSGRRTQRAALDKIARVLTGVRDAAMIALLYPWGLRRAEIVSLDLPDYDPDTGELVVRGKRNKQRRAHLVEGAQDALADWLLFAETLQGHSSGLSPRVGL